MHTHIRTHACTYTYAPPTAQMSTVYGKVEEQSVQYWNYAFLSDIVREYKDSRDLPAPFNILKVGVGVSPR